MKKEIVIVINPGSTSTKVALYDHDGQITLESIVHSQIELGKFARISQQLPFRIKAIESFLSKAINFETMNVVGIVGRGGIVKPLSGGTYQINKAFLQDASNGTYGEHASNLGCLIANKLKIKYDLTKVYTVDPVSSGNITEVAQISGVPEIKRVGRGHPLNMKMTARKIATKLDLPYDESDFIIAHLGGGISIAHVKAGQILDVNDALLGMGPFSPNRAGALPLRGLLELSKQLTEKELNNKLSKESGLKGYLGTGDLPEVMGMIDNGDEKAKLIYDAFVYQTAKEIGSYFAASKAKAQAIIITGGIANNQRFTEDLKSYVGNLTEYIVYPGENEMEALAEGIFRVIDQKEVAQEY